MPVIDTTDLESQALAGVRHYESKVDYPDQEIDLSGNHYYYGDMVLNGSDITVDGIIYVQGNLTISGGNVGGNATFVVEGQTYLGGSDAYWTTADPTSNLTFVSLYQTDWENPERAIEISGSVSEYRGIFYAPYGEMEISASEVTVYGSVYADSMYWGIQGSKNKFIWEQIGGGTQRTIRLIE
jgi:hypothetical protein